MCIGGGGHGYIFFKTVQTGSGGPISLLFNGYRWVLMSEAERPAPQVDPSPSWYGQRQLHLCFCNITLCTCGARWLSRLRHYATTRQVAGSIPDGVTGIFH
jgi:hypothetical protein